ncbi:hypothetical protein BH09BAC5_BH09BAC5_26090 [soil metagenome]
MKEERWINILIYISVFVSSITFFREPFEGYLHYVIFLLLLPVFIKQFGLPVQTLLFLLLPLLVGAIEILMGNNTWALFLKIFIGMLLSISFYHYVIQYFKWDTEKMFRLYLKGAVIVCYIGIIQFVSYIIHFSPGYNYSWLFNKWGIVSGGFGIRLNSVFSEASQFAIVISPACFVAFHNLIPGTNKFGISRIQSIVVLVCLILTSSSTGYMGLLIILVLFVINYGQVVYLLLGVLVMVVGVNILYNNVAEFKSRVDTSVGLWISEEFSVENINSSSFVLYNNYHIAIENFKSNPLTGTGFGSHPIAFDKYSLTNQSGFLDISFNKSDANSMLLRLISETGLIGILFIIIFIRRNFIIRDAYDNKNADWIISNGILVLILMFLLRQGNYFLNGFPFFMLLYYYTNKQRQQRRWEQFVGISNSNENVDGDVEEENNSGESASDVNLN